MGIRELVSRSVSPPLFLLFPSQIPPLFVSLLSPAYLSSFYFLIFLCAFLWSLYVCSLVPQYLFFIYLALIPLFPGSCYLCCAMTPTSLFFDRIQHQPTDFKKYKSSIPSCGAVMVNHALNKVCPCIIDAYNSLYSRVVFSLALAWLQNGRNPIKIRKGVMSKDARL